LDKGLGGLGELEVTWKSLGSWKAEDRCSWGARHCRRHTTTFYSEGRTASIFSRDAPRVASGSERATYSF
jgi:hypothetical protein